MKMMVDAIDLKILKLLQKNARMKITEIAKAIVMSIPSIVNRIEKMEQKGIIRGYHAQVDASKIGMEVHGYIIASVQSVMLSRLYAYVASVEEIVRCETIISGGKEIFMEIYLCNIDQLMKFYESDIRKYVDSMTVYLVNSSEGDKKLLPFQLLLNQTEADR